MEPEEFLFICVENAVAIVFTNYASNLPIFVARAQFILTASTPYTYNTHLATTPLPPQHQRND